MPQYIALKILGVFDRVTKQEHERKTRSQRGPGFGAIHGPYICSGPRGRGLTGKQDESSTATFEAPELWSM